MATQQRPPAAVSVSEDPQVQSSKPSIVGKHLETDYPLIDCDPHFKRVVRYARGSDYAAGGAVAVGGPAFMLWLERVSPTGASRSSFASIMRLSVALSVTGGFILMYARSQNRFYGLSENRREIDMDMREMTDRVKQGLPIYGKSRLTEYMQGAAARQSRYSGFFLHVMPWANFVNHPHHGVDTAKYYQQAERELEAERSGKGL